MVRFVARMILGVSLIILVAMSGAMSMYSKDHVIAYTVGNDRAHDLNLTDIDHALTVSYPISRRYVFSIDWSSQGSYLMLSTAFSDGFDLQLLVNGRWEPFHLGNIRGEVYSWSPDERYLVFTDDTTSTNYDVYRVDHSGENLQRLFEMEGAEWFPTFSPDRRWIAFLSIVNQQNNSSQNAMLYDTITGEIQTIHPDETQTTGMFAISWSPDSQQIAYAILKPDRHVAIAIRDITEGTSRMLLPELKEDNFAPEWSAEGQRIAFRTATHSYIVDVDGQNMTLVTADFGDVEALKWSGDGAYLLAVGEQGLGLSGNHMNVLYVIDASQLDDYQRIYSGVLTSMPVWQP